MSSFRIPYQNQIRQLNRFEDAGEIIESFNLDLGKKLGKINTSQKLLKILDESDVNDEIIHVLTDYSGYYYVLTDSDTYRCNINSDPTNSANWVTEAGLSAAGVGFESDGVQFDGKLIVSTDTDMTSWNGSVDDTAYWTTTVSGTALTANYPHILHVHRGGQETLLVTDKNLIRYYNATAGHSTVTLQADLVASCMTSGVKAIWVGTYSEALDIAYVYELYIGEQIDSVPVARNAYKVEGKAVLSIETIDNVPYIITDRGNLQKFNGAGFSTVAQLPFSGSNIVLNGVEPGLIQDSSSSRPVHPKGMKRFNQSILLNFKSEKNGGNYPDHTPSGIWEYDSETRQLTHRMAFSDSTTYAGTSITNRTGHLLVPNNENTFILALAEPDETGLMGLYGNSSDTPQAHFITSEIESDTVEDAFESVYQKAKTLASGEKIEIKWRNTKRDKIFAECSYTSQKQINTTASVTGIEVGDEVTDTYTGLIAHITKIETSELVTNIYLDTDIGTENTTRLFEFQNFKPIGYDMRDGTYNISNKTTYTSDDGEYRRDGGFSVNPWVQFKVVFYGDIEYRQFMLEGKSKVER